MHYPFTHEPLVSEFRRWEVVVIHLPVGWWLTPVLWTGCQGTESSWRLADMWSYLEKEYLISWLTPSALPIHDSSSPLIF
jgi:hypothetical protein